jgi:hypothetical protein
MSGFLRSDLQIVINGDDLRAQVRRGEEPPWYEWQRCSTCGGALLTSLVLCDECRGARGKWATTPLLAEMLSTEEGRAAYMAYQHETHLRQHGLGLRPPTMGKMPRIQEEAEPIDMEAAMAALGGT